MVVEANKVVCAKFAHATQRIVKGPTTMRPDWVLKCKVCTILGLRIGENRSDLLPRGYD